MKKNIFILVLSLMTSILFAQGVQETHKSSIDFLCTGIGESKNDPKNNEYPVKIIFASTSRALYTDIDVSIYSVQKNSENFLTKIFCEESWLLMRLEPGEYLAKGKDARGQEKNCRLNVKKDMKAQCVLTWPDL